MTLAMRDQEKIQEGLRQGRKEGREEGQNLLLKAIEGIRNGLSDMAILADGVDEKTLALAKTVKL